jgi:capsular polysaccharide biosynthesis protein
MPISYPTILHARTSVIAGFAGLGLLLSLLISFVQPLKYSSTVRLLVLQDVGATVDAYTATRSEERIAENLTNIIYFTTFFDQVMNAGFSIDEKSFPTQDYKRRREWAKTVSASVSRGSGLLNITAYSRNVAEAEQIVRAVAFVLTEHADEYNSGGKVEVKLIDAPLNSRFPVKPNIFANAVSGLVLGGLVGCAYVIISYERIRRRHQLAHGE